MLNDLCSHVIKQFHFLNKVSMSETSADIVGNEAETCPTGAAQAANSQSDAATPSTPNAETPLESDQLPPPSGSNTAGQRTIRREFPPFTRSLLRVRVPVVVTLAQKKQTLGRILEMGPGQIIQFEKSCDEILDMEAGNCLIASGEAVKIGDKFGLRITSIVPPEERFIPVRPKDAALGMNKQ